MIDGPRDAKANAPSGVNEVKLRHGKILCEGLKTSLTDLRLRKNYCSARARWNTLCNSPAIFLMGRERAKLSYFWERAYTVAESGRYAGAIVNPDTGRPIYFGEDGERLMRSDFKKTRLAGWLGLGTEGEEKPNAKRWRTLYSPLWQADRSRIHPPAGRLAAPVRSLPDGLCGLSLA